MATPCFSFFAFFLSMRHFLLFLLLIPTALFADNSAIDSLESVMRNAPQIQEKIYLHTDNSMYFIGDTLWYKAYVLRSDDHKPTNYSRLLYVELLSPDGIVVERQHIVLGDAAQSCGQFVLTDSLYSGYYELRAYTRWQLNFNVGHRHHTMFDDRKFYSKQMADDFYREYQDLYSRVLPVYAKPEVDGQFSRRYMHSRPKQRLQKEKINLQCRFYPEGGRLVEGLTSRVAYELTDNNGQAIDVEGKLTNGQTIKPVILGRGTFDCNPSDKTELKVHWNDKNYTFSLPKAEKTGAVVRFDADKRVAHVTASGTTVAAAAVLCRGRVVHFERINAAAGNTASGVKAVDIDLSSVDMPTGVNEFVIYDDNARLLAARQFFVNNNDVGRNLEVRLESQGSEVDSKTTVNPRALIDLSLKAEADGAQLPKKISVAVRDASTDEPGYDDGNILTDMLLSGDLRGFVASPAYYFESNDDAHRQHLDLLMMVQGWRKYKRERQLRYLPEINLSFEGCVYQLPSTVDVIEIDDVENIIGSFHSDASSVLIESPGAQEADGGSGEADDTGWTLGDDTAEPEPEVTYAQSDYQYTRLIKKPVYVEAELTRDGQVMGVVAETDNQGRFRINLPAYYDRAVLFLKAYAKSDSIKKCLTSPSDKGRADERAFPDYYVKRDMIFPVFTKPYSWYQVNSPDFVFIDEDDDEMIPSSSRLAGNHMLQTVIVKAKRRGARAIDMSKPAIVRDAYDIYNDVTDYGMSPGVLDYRYYPVQVATLLFGNMGMYQNVNVRAMIEGSSFYRNYSPLTGREYDKNVSAAYMFNNLRLNRTQNIRAYTDYELRTDSGLVHQAASPDVTLVFELVPDNGKRYTYRDRRYILDGITYPEEFYSPNYGNATLNPNAPADYRRTLYWNPNATLDEEGKFNVKIYNNGKETRLRVSAAGVSSDGQIYTNE